MIAGQGTLLGRTMHGIRYDAIHDEIVVPHQFGQAVLVFRGGASGEEPPIRVIQGSRTQMMAPDRVDIDPVNNEILVPEEDHLLVFPREANGNVAPKRVLRTPNASYSESNVDPVRNLLVIGGRVRTDNQRLDALMVFQRTDSRNDAAALDDRGPEQPLFRIGAHGSERRAGAGVRNHPGATPSLLDESFVGAWNYVEDKGEAPPRWTIGGPKGMLRQPRGVVLDPKNKALIVSDKYLNAVLTYYFPEVF